MRRNHGMVCPICGINHRKYPVKCAAYARIRYNGKLHIGIDNETVSAFNEYCFIRGFITEPTPTPTSRPYNTQDIDQYSTDFSNGNPDWYDTMNSKEDNEENKIFFNIDKELFKI